MSRPRPLIVRDAGTGRFAELFLVCAVATVLGLRGLLAATGYPQLGAGRVRQRGRGVVSGIPGSDPPAPAGARGRWAWAPFAPAARLL